MFLKKKITAIAIVLAAMTTTTFAEGFTPATDKGSVTLELVNRSIDSLGESATSGGLRLGGSIALTDTVAVELGLTNFEFDGEPLFDVKVYVFDAGVSKMWILGNRFSIKVAGGATISLADYEVLGYSSDTDALLGLYAGVDAGFFITEHIEITAGLRYDLVEDTVGSLDLSGTTFGIGLGYNF